VSDRPSDRTLGVPVAATVVSVVIRDFIHLTERVSSASLTSLMGDYYEKVCVQVAQQRGVLTSIGNHSMMVTFSGVEGEDTHARRALRCSLAIAMIAYQTRFWIRQAFPEQGLDKFGVGIGIHSGELVFAEFGLPPNMREVANGHAVSVASLLAVKSREMGWNIVCSEHALAVAGRGVQTKRHAMIGAEWLRHPVKVAEVVVVREGEEKTAEGGLHNTLDVTLALDGGTCSGHSSACSPEQVADARRASRADFPDIPGYRCVRAIGQGGMSRVFLVERLRDGAHFALKFADGSVSEDSDVLYRFVEEYGLLEQVRHSNVLKIYDQGVTDDVLFIVMEYLAGGTLKQLIGANGMAPERAWGVLREMAEAMAEVHKMGIIHRDIKPDNILLRGNGAAVLGDFGVARRMHKVRNAGRMEYIAGTPYFMSPEQALGEEEDERTDIYSMGAVFFNMLTGEKPYTGNTLEEIVQQHLHKPIPKLPPHYRHWQFLLNRMMSKDKEGRYSASDLLGVMRDM
jgi:serine/threonine-protein kinase PpkA